MYFQVQTQDALLGLLLSLYSLLTALSGHTAPPIIFSYYDVNLFNNNNNNYNNNDEDGKPLVRDATVVSRFGRLRR